MRTVGTLLGTVLSMLLYLSLAGCGEEGPAEKAARKLDQMADDAKDKYEEMKKSVSDDQ